MTRIMIAAIAAFALSAAAAGAQGRAAAPKTTATAAQLATLPGIGPMMAGRIIEYRQKAGAFKKIEELMNVRGVGEKSFLKMKPLITVAAAKTASAQEE